MKLFKLANSEEAQKKAFRLGYSWKYKEDVYSICLEKPYLFLCNDGDMNLEEDLDIFIEDPAEGITQKEFMRICEPKKHEQDRKIKEIEKTIEDLQKQVKELKA